MGILLLVFLHLRLNVLCGLPGMPFLRLRETAPNMLSAPANSAPVPLRFTTARAYTLALKLALTGLPLTAFGESLDYEKAHPASLKLLRNVQLCKIYFERQAWQDGV